MSEPVNHRMADGVWNGPMDKVEFNALATPGVAFPPEQRAQVESLLERGDFVGAQKIILDLLEAAFGN